MAINSEQFQRLPQFAQRELAGLQTEVENLRAKLAEGPYDSNTFVNTGSSRPDRPLGRGTRIRFVTPGGPIEVFLDDRGLQVRGEWNLTLKPQSSNSVMLTTEV